MAWLDLLILMEEFLEKDKKCKRSVRLFLPCWKPTFLLSLLRHDQQHSWAKTELQRSGPAFLAACESRWEEGRDREKFIKRGLMVSNHHQLLPGSLNHMRECDFSNYRSYHYS